MSDVIRVLVVDDHLIVREGLRLMLETADDIELVGDAADGAVAVRLVADLQPRVVLMDLRMPGMDGIEAIERIHREWPQLAVVILTTYNEDQLMLRGLRAGARGFLLKDTDLTTLLETIRAAARDAVLLRPEVLARVLARTAVRPPSGDAYDLALTEREQEVLAGAAAGERNKEIATRLGISERTVRAHLATIYGKLGADSRAAAVARAMRQGLLDGNST